MYTPVSTNEPSFLSIIYKYIIVIIWPPIRYQIELVFPPRAILDWGEGGNAAF